MHHWIPAYAGMTGRLVGGIGFDGKQEPFRVLTRAPGWKELSSDQKQERFRVSTVESIDDFNPETVLREGRS